MNDEFDILKTVLSALRNKPRFNLVNRTWESRDEPAWNSRTELTRCLKVVKLQNEKQILNGISATSTALDDIVKARNFFAHRSKYLEFDLRNCALRYNITSNKADIIITSFTSNNRRLLQDWIDDLKQISELMVA